MTQTKPLSPILGQLINLSWVYWVAQCALGLIAMGTGNFRPLVFLGAAIVGAFPVVWMAQTLFFKRTKAVALKAWGLRCALALLLQLCAATYACYRPGKEAAILWAAATILLTFVLYVCRRYIFKATA